MSRRPAGKSGSELYKSVILQLDHNIPMMISGLPGSQLNVLVYDKNEMCQLIIFNVLFKV